MNMHSNRSAMRVARTMIAAAALMALAGCVYGPPPPGPPPAYGYDPGYYYAPGYYYGPQYYGPPVSLSFGFWGGGGGGYHHHHWR
jgi:hypothetical protein